MGRALRPGEEVTWPTGQPRDRAIKRGEIRSQGGTADNPEYAVESSRNNKRASKRKSLRKPDVGS